MDALIYKMKFCWSSTLSAEGIDQCINGRVGAGVVSRQTDGAMEYPLRCIYYV